MQGKVAVSAERFNFKKYRLMLIKRKNLLNARNKKYKLWEYKTKACINKDIV